ncbi:MAG: glycine cleavage system protein GcvH [Candidatus Marinimicrobia bacterium]|jgi:glycine cleavage system H protein|nr:glycine cleavage system protein GcvH [Candidatus Neomarinimicrobiota bacterium]MCK9484483.1 glycine cleavage system protein GcvH [Candidatus Neomarinimicrobiota bacterium]MCK9559915.1 glycine cleavage system protein GcvH [Candidatus Neomarinimicrobiota bacterium]MDD5061085.1 glycine cleavage system protein GcvH [Candidatus Neomarinimicrobiota bacterium]MDD5230878.1 glycine cleavage system protein GcvH [Candidatus Neomarinimicrobiota bacterium]
MNVPADLKYTKDHEWARVEGAVAVVGITEYAQSQLGDVVYIELPKVGDVISRGDVIGTIEAVKTVADIYSPLSGEIVAVNAALKDASELVNKDPFGEGWITNIKLADPAELNTLLEPSDYEKLIS